MFFKTLIQSTSQLLTMPAKHWLCLGVWTSICEQSFDFLCGEAHTHVGNTRPVTAHFSHTGATFCVEPILHTGIRFPNTFSILQI